MPIVFALEETIKGYLGFGFKDQQKRRGGGGGVWYGVQKHSTYKES